MSVSKRHLGCCVNCRHSPGKKCVNPEQEIISEIEVDTQDDPIKVTVAESLSSIYKLEYLEKLKFLDTKNTSSATTNNNENGEEKKIGVCQKCHSVLAQLFKLFNQFNELRVFDSYLSQKLDKLDGLIRRLQPQENSGETIKSEPETEDDYGSDYSPDMSQFMEVNLEEGHHPKSTHLKVYTNKRKNNVSVMHDQEIISATTTTTINQRLRNKKSRVNINIDDDDDGQTNFGATTTTTCSAADPFDIKDESSMSSPASTTSFSSLTKKKTVNNSRKNVTREPNKFEKNDEKEFHDACHICQVSFKMSRNLHTHLLTHIGPENACPFPNCSKSYGNRQNVLAHLRLNHFERDRRNCPVLDCPKAINHQHKLREHIRGHWKTGLFICDHCHQKFSTKAILLSHRQSNHSKTAHKCPACPDETFKTELQLKTHLKTCHPGVNLFSCTVCSSSHPTKRALDQHSVIHKEDRQVYRCPRNCERKFNTELQAKEHEEKCTYDVYRCDLCSKSFSTKYYFHLHQKMHKEGPTFKCDFEGCDKAYVNSSSLAHHRRKHSGLRPFVCHECGMAFFDSSKLKTHFEVHSTEKPHLCSVCGKRFVRIGGLKSHMTSHNESKQFPCSHCDKVFKFKASQHLHFMTVHKEGFSCHVCGAKFPYNVTLQKHLASVHPHEHRHGST